MEDWPDWSDQEEGQSKDGHSVQIHIQEPQNAESVNRVIAYEDKEEEPWEDFKETGKSSDSFLGSVDPSQSTESFSASVKPEAQRPRTSKPLKLGSAPSTQSRRTSSFDDAWTKEAAQNSGLKPAATKNQGGVGLGEEFTIKVKKAVKQDPEMDLFADMVPDIKLSSAGLLSLEEVKDSSGNTKPLQEDSSIAAGTLTAKFAAADLPEVSLHSLPLKVPKNIQYIALMFLKICVDLFPMKIAHDKTSSRNEEFLT